MLIVVADQDEELGSNEGLEKSKERAVCNKIYFTTINPHHCFKELTVFEYMVQNALMEGEPQSTAD